MQYLLVKRASFGNVQLEECPWWVWASIIVEGKGLTNEYSFHLGDFFCLGLTLNSVKSSRKDTLLKYLESQESESSEKD